MRQTLCLLVLAMTLLPGCAVLSRTAVEEPDVPAMAKVPYPRAAELGADLDIVVVRQGRNIRLVNRTPHSVSNVQLWLNEEWVGNVTTIVIGTDNLMPLPNFVNLHEETFPVGGLLTPDKTSAVVLAELFDPATGKRHRLNTRASIQDAVIADLTGED